MNNNDYYDDISHKTEGKDTSGLTGRNYIS